MRITNILKRHRLLLLLSSFIYNLVFSPSLIFHYFHRGGVKFHGSFLKNVKINVRGNSTVYIGPKTIMQNCIFIAYGPQSSIHIEGGSTNIKNSSFIANQDYGKIYISYGFTSEGCDIKAHEGKNIIIGRDCMFSSGISMSTSDYHSTVSISDGVRINKSKDIIIGNHVWLGRKVDILKGVQIADDIVVGMDSLVSKALDSSHSIYAGTPARIVKSDITWKRPMI